MNIRSIRPIGLPKDYSSIKSKVESYQVVSRRWAGHLSGNEMAMVEVLLDRTVGWGRREAYFTIRALLSGDGTYSGLTMSRRTAFRVLASLENRGLIQRRKDINVPDRVHFTVNLGWLPENAETELASLQDRCHNGTIRCQDGTDQCQKGTLYTGINLQVSTTGILAGAPAPLELAEKKIVREEGGGSAAAPAGDARGMPDAPQAAVDVVEAAWRAGVRKAFPGKAYRTWGVREKAQVKQVLRNWRGACTFPDFVTWTVTNWTAIMRKQFKWMTKSPPPATPALSFLIAFLTQFADARAENVLEDWLSSEDRTEIEKMMGRGQTYEQATASLAKTKAAAGLRKEIEKGKLDARVRDYAATRKLAEAKKLAELEGRVPIHPKSPAALRMIEEERRAKARPVPANVLRESAEPLQGAEVYFVDPYLNPFDHQ